MKIQHLVINQLENMLAIEFASSKSISETFQLPFEYLRVFSPVNTNAKVDLVCHKKLVKIIAIENVAKHGVRLLFDDQHSAIYSCDYLAILVNQQAERWQDYLAQVEASGHSREAMIEVKQV